MTSAKELIELLKDCQKHLEACFGDQCRNDNLYLDIKKALAKEKAQS